MYSCTTCNAKGLNVPFKRISKVYSWQGDAKGHSMFTQFADKTYSCFCWIVQGSQFYLSIGQTMCEEVFAGRCYHSVHTQCADKVYSYQYSHNTPTQCADNVVICVG